MEAGGDRFSISKVERNGGLRPPGLERNEGRGRGTVNSRRAFTVDTAVDSYPGTPSELPAAKVLERGPRKA
jgi:hypothetical protein